MKCYLSILIFSGAFLFGLYLLFFGFNDDERKGIDILYGIIFMGLSTQGFIMRKNKAKRSE